ncbi:hypothetical protein H310_13577 [Aphanomyces invadans]|uniref:Phospholipid-transporting ATPase n=1 Tax=Aphanomyces invadans TaxID=157072 RepID=A0A024TEN3_9STRA|nr:hypothetical protein H310_13577 [Aphanomyces invadans]ETV92051.1 hypothetical protein H310_13577 [Aphanomyces invadans]|eukprot:XP_008879348.1 hypothetical protein H310_13577 [Aphanomyces invadans]
MGHVEDAYREVAPSPKVPSSTERSGAASMFRQLWLNPTPTESHGPFCTNVVVTSKYTMWTFIPKFTVESFAKLANAYFLLVSVLQCIPAITNTGWPSTLPVLLFILAVDGTLAIIEDRRRHQADDEANSAKCRVVYNGQLVTVPWSAVQVGQVVKLANRDTAPADLLILAVHEVNAAHKAGICYVETKSLDGETNLKLRQAMESTLHAQTEADIHALHGRVECEVPNKVISRFNGSFFVDLLDGSVANDPISIKNILLRGCQLRNTEWMYGLVINTGPDTKIMQSFAAPETKWSSINGHVNVMIKWLLAMLLVLCACAASAQVSWVRPSRMPALAWYVTWLTLHRFVACGQYFLLLYQMIPVSLYVTISTVMLIQAMLMALDLDMYYEPLDSRMIVRTMALNEELGQISYVFSDKTGTLTCNVMEFRKCSINGVSYGLGTTEIGRAALRRKGLPVPEVQSEHEHRNVPFVNFHDPALRQKLADIPLNGTNALTKEADFFLHLAICHTVIPEQATDKNGESVLRYSASSPDEQALVSAAKFFGFAFESRGLGVARIRITNKALQHDPNAPSELWEFKVLDVLEFNSDRKRMSCVVQDPSGNYILLTKGADNVITPLLSSTLNDSDVVATTFEQLQSFADDGLRTLTIAKKTIPTAYYHQWTKRYKAACASLDQIEKRKNGQANDIDACMVELEQDLVLLGATAIEDKLQDNVPRAIARLMEAGMKVWVLTGDKQETAINIAYACQLMDNDMMQYIFNLDEYPDLTALLDEMLSADVEITRRSLVIDGDALEMVMADADTCAMFLKVAMACDSVVCCRVSPSQKAEVVGLVRTNNRKARTLAIGDGANDVAMIQRAHVGVGICGQEGMQAVNSSDYAIAQFYFLEKLLLHHGRLNYVRMSKLVGYMFYKNMIMVLAQYFFLYMTGSSGQKEYSEVGFQLYNLIYTSLPIGVLGVFDYDVPWAVGQRFPALYKVGISGELFTTSVFFTWIAAAIFEAVVIFAVAVLGFNQLEVGAGSGDLQQYGIVLFTLVVLVANFKIISIQQTWIFWGGVAWFVGVLAYIPVTLTVESNWLFLSQANFGATQNTLNGPTFWFVLPLTIVLCLLRNFSWKVFQRAFYPFLWQIVQEQYVAGEPTTKSRSLEAGIRVPDHGSDLETVWLGGTLPTHRNSSYSRHSNASSRSVSRVNSGYAFSADPHSSMAEGIMITRHDDESMASAMKAGADRVRETPVNRRTSEFTVPRQFRRASTHPPVQKPPTGVFI